MWTYQGNEITSIEQAPEGAIGFIYKMISQDSGRKYIGRKMLFSHRKRNLNKKEVAALANKRLKKWEFVVKETDWLDYQSSCVEIHEELETGTVFNREILCWTFSKMETTYLEVKYLFQNNVLESDEWYNKNIASKWFKGNIGQHGEESN